MIPEGHLAQNARRSQQIRWSSLALQNRSWRDSCHPVPGALL